MFKVVKFRWLKFAFQRLFRGWDDSDTWSLDATIARLTLPRLKRFRKIGRCYPAGMSESQWDNVLSDIEFYLEHVKDSYTIERQNELRTKEDRRCIKGRRLWRRHFEDLWW